LKCGFGGEWQKINFVDKVTDEEVLQKYKRTEVFKHSPTTQVTSIDELEAS